MTDDKDKAPEPTVGNITDINEFAAKKYDEMKLEELKINQLAINSPNT